MRTRSSVGEEETLRLAAGVGNGKHVARVHRCDGDGRHVASCACIECVWHAHELLHALNAVGVAACRVDFGFEVVRTAGPVDAGHGTVQHGALAHFDGEQTVGVGGSVVHFHIYRSSVDAALDNGDAGRDSLVRHQRVIGVTHNCLIAHLLRRLCKQGCHREHQNKEK